MCMDLSILRCMMNDPVRLRSGDETKVKKFAAFFIR